MMLLKTKNLKLLNKIITFSYFFIVSVFAYSQEIINDPVSEKPEEVIVDSLNQRIKIDGVAAVI